VGRVHHPRIKGAGIPPTQSTKLSKTKGLSPQSLARGPFLGNGSHATDGNPWIVQIQPAVLSRLPLHDECSQPIFGSEVPHLIAPVERSIAPCRARVRDVNVGARTWSNQVDVGAVWSGRGAGQSLPAGIRSVILRHSAFIATAHEGIFGIFSIESLLLSFEKTRSFYETIFNCTCPSHRDLN
jgi:hypothetical protein